MVEKRFKMGESDIQGEMIFIDTETNKVYWQEYFDEIVDLLNELSIENRRLKEKYDYDIEDYRQSNAELKKENGEQQATIEKLEKENKGLKEVLQKSNPYFNCTLKTKDDLLYLQYIFQICKLLIDDAVIEEDYDLATGSISQFYNRMQHFNQDKNGEKRTNFFKFGVW